MGDFNLRWLQKIFVFFNKVNRTPGGSSLMWMWTLFSSCMSSVWCTELAGRSQIESNIYTRNPRIFLGFKSFSHNHSTMCRYYGAASARWVTAQRIVQSSSREHCAFRDVIGDKTIAHALVLRAMPLSKQTLHPLQGDRLKSKENKPWIRRNLLVR